METTLGKKKKEICIYIKKRNNHNYYKFINVFILFFSLKKNSQGQRQLIALARALVRKSALIILDEATSSVDFDTDRRIQNTIRSEFADVTILTIAHRINTIIDYDRILVLDQGKLIEYDTPYNLITKQDGHFRSMCENSGEFSELLSIATSKHQH